MTAFDDAEGEDWSSNFMRWAIPALVLSILLHVGLFLWIGRWPVVASEKQYYDKIVPRTFQLHRVDIDPKLLEPEPAEKKQAAMAPEAVKLPEEHVSFEKLMAADKGTPTVPKIDQKILAEKPSASTTDLTQSLNSGQVPGTESSLKDPLSMQQAILEDKPDAGSAAVTDLLRPDSLTGRAIAQAGPAKGADTPGFSNLDDLLARTGPLTAETAPILMPTDLLFDYDHAELRPEALASLQKLGLLIQRNPQATFEIEGHTDNFGTDQYNQDLSQRRAEMVKAWLINTMNIPANKVTAHGFGKSRLLVPGGSIEQQQINRRVEIVIHTAQ